MNTKIKKPGSILKWILVTSGIFLVLFWSWVWLSTYHPADVQSQTVVCSEDTPLLKQGQKLKVLNWNVQYMAGKNYVFFYDLPDNSGPDERPSSEDIEKTLKEVARIIRDENPDIILLQEVNVGAKRTDYKDQLAELLLLLPEESASCYTSAFYWKASFVPHPCIMGSVGMKLVVLSKYRISEATRHQLALLPEDPLTRQFKFKRAVLEVRMPVEGAKDFVLLNTHLSAWAKGTGVLEKQVAQVNTILEKLTQEKHSWIIGGDFNLLPPGKAYSLLKDNKKEEFNKETEIKPLYEKYKVVPSLKEVNGPDYQKWFTFFPNDPSIEEPDLTADYIFMSDDLQLGKHYVRQHDTLEISDHLPLIAEIELP